MVAKTGIDVGLDQQLVSLLRSPVRVKALVVLLERTASPKEISDELRISLSSASYQVQELLKMGLIEQVDERPIRGTVAHYYRAVKRPIWSEDEWAELSQEERQNYVVWAMQLINLDVVRAIHEGTFNAYPETHTSRSPLCVDEEGRLKLNGIQDEAMKAGFEAEAESAKRLAKSGEDPVHVTAVNLCIEMPAPKSRARGLDEGKLRSDELIVALGSRIGDGLRPLFLEDFK